MGGGFCGISLEKGAGSVVPKRFLVAKFGCEQLICSGCVVLHGTHRLTRTFEQAQTRFLSLMK